MMQLLSGEDLKKFEEAMKAEKKMAKFMNSLKALIKMFIYSIRGMNKESYFTTRVGRIKYEEDTKELQEDGINPFAKPFVYMKYGDKIKINTRHWY